MGIQFKYSFYDDGTRHNAFADEKSNTIYLGDGLINDCLSQPDGLYCLSFIFLHEASHLYQYKDRNNKLLEGPTVKYFELQADCLASKILNFSFKDRNSDKFKSMTELVFSLGDYYVKHREHHGTPYEREIACFVWWDIYISDLSDFYKKSFYLFSRKSCKPCAPITHGSIEILQKNGYLKRYGIGLDLNIYDNPSYEGYGMKSYIRGRYIPSKHDTEFDIKIIIYNENTQQSKAKDRSGIYYYIHDSKVFSDPTYTVIAGYYGSKEKSYKEAVEEAKRRRIENQKKISIEKNVNE